MQARPRTVAEPASRWHGGMQPRSLPSLKLCSAHEKKGAGRFNYPKQSHAFSCLCRRPPRRTPRLAGARPRLADFSTARRPPCPRCLEPRRTTETPLPGASFNAKGKKTKQKTQQPVIRQGRGLNVPVPQRDPASDHDRLRHLLQQRTASGPRNNRGPYREPTRAPSVARRRARVVSCHQSPPTHRSTAAGRGGVRQKQRQTRSC